MSSSPSVGHLPTEVRRSDTFVGADLAGSAGCDHLPEVEDVHVARQTEDEVHVVFDDEHAEVAFATKRSEQRREPRALLVVESGRRFVEEQKERVGGEGASDFEDARETHRQICGSGVSVIGEADELEKFDGAPFGATADIEARRPS